MTVFGLGAELKTDYEPISLSALEFDVLWEHLRLGPMPLVVKVPSPGKTDEERDELEQLAWSDLEARGLGRPVSVHPDLEAALHVLARSDREIDGRAYVEGSVRLIVATAGVDAAIAVLGDGRVTIRRTAVTSLANHASVAAELLPSRPAGPGQSVSLRSVDFEAAANDAGGSQPGFHAALLDRGIRDDDASALASMINDVRGTGNFGAAARDRLGRRQRADRVVSFFDTDDGRYVQIRRRSGDGQLWTTISPADPRRLVAQVEQLLTEITRSCEE
jgi:hypothetical protein